MKPGPEFAPDAVIRVERRILVDVLVAHQRHNSRSCLCGWDFLGKSHCEHVADIVQECSIDPFEPRPDDGVPS